MQGDVLRRQRLILLQSIAPGRLEAGLLLVFLLQPLGVAPHQVPFIGWILFIRPNCCVEENVIFILQLEVGQRRVLGVGFPRVGILVLQQVHHRLDQEVLAVFGPVDKACTCRRHRCS